MELLDIQKTAIRSAYVASCRPDMFFHEDEDCTFSVCAIDPRLWKHGDPKDMDCHANLDAIHRAVRIWSLFNRNSTPSMSMQQIQLDFINKKFVYSDRFAGLLEPLNGNYTVPALEESLTCTKHQTLDIGLPVCDDFHHVLDVINRRLDDGNIYVLTTMYSVAQCLKSRFCDIIQRDPDHSDDFDRRDFLYLANALMLREEIFYSLDSSLDQMKRWLVVSSKSACPSNDDESFLLSMSTIGSRDDDAAFTIKIVDIPEPNVTDVDRFIEKAHNWFDRLSKMFLVNGMDLRSEKGDKSCFQSHFTLTEMISKPSIGIFAKLLTQQSQLGDYWKENH